MAGRTVGVLALQGAFALHSEALGRCGVTAIEVRTPDELSACDALVLPGGESTTMANLLRSFDFVEPLRSRVEAKFPLFGTCAGMILLAKIILDGQPDQLSFAALDIDVRRNGYGRQVNSFEADIDIPAVGKEPLRGVFIRAPKVDRVGSDVEVLAEHQGAAVLCRQESVLVSAFHPELTGDDRLHQLFVDSLA